MSELKLTCAIVDDDPAALESSVEIIRNFFPNLIVAAVFSNPLEALKMIPDLNCDFILVDVQMPVLNGIDLAKALPEHNRPEIVFLTGYDSYAIEAFKVRARDYIIKPLSPLHLKEYLAAFTHRALKARSAYDVGLNLLLVNRVDKALVLDLETINYLTASGPYTHIHMCDGTAHVATKTLKHFNYQLHGKGFLRAHRSFLFNARNLAEIKKESDGTGVVYFKSGHHVSVTFDCKNSLINQLMENSQYVE